MIGEGAAGVIAITAGVSLITWTWLPLAIGLILVGVASLFSALTE